MLLRDEEDLPVWLHAHASALPCSSNESERSHWERQAARRAALSNAARGLHERLPSAVALRDACSVDDDRRAACAYADGVEVGKGHYRVQQGS